MNQDFKNGPTAERTPVRVETSASGPQAKPAFAMSIVDQIEIDLTELERERITGWQGPSGAAYNEISESLCSRGILDKRWALTPFGEAVKAELEKI